MQTIKPLSAVGALTTNTTNFPQCIFAITPDSVIAANQLRDVIAGTVWTLGGGGILTNNGNGSFSRNATAGSFSLTSGAMPAVGNSDPMMLVVGTLADADEVGVGDDTGATGPGLSLKVGTVSDAFVGRAAANFHSVGGITKVGLTAGAFLSVFDQSANTGAVHLYDTSYETVASTATLGTLAGTWAAFASALVIPVSVTLNGIYVLKWTDKPSADECKAAVAWMAANPTLGLYPGWLKRT